MNRYYVLMGVLYEEFLAHSVVYHGNDLEDCKSQVAADKHAIVYYISTTKIGIRSTPTWSHTPERGWKELTGMFEQEADIWT